MISIIFKNSNYVYVFRCPRMDTGWVCVPLVRDANPPRMDTAVFYSCSGCCLSCFRCSAILGGFASRLLRDANPPRMDTAVFYSCSRLIVFRFVVHHDKSLIYLQSLAASATSRSNPRRGRRKSVAIVAMLISSHNEYIPSLGDWHPCSGQLVVSIELL